MNSTLNIAIGYWIDHVFGITMMELGLKMLLSKN